MNPTMLLIVLLLLCASALANTTDVQLGALGATASPDLGTLVALLLKAEAHRVTDRLEAERRREVAERRHEVAERRHESLLQAISEISDAVVTAATSERVYACALAGTVLLETLNWAGIDNRSQFCSATPLFSAQPQAESTYFLTSAHCFTDITRDGAAFASATILYFSTLTRSCSLVHHFFCHPSDPSACTAATPSMDLAIVRCAAPVPVPSTRLAVLPQQHFQRAFLFGFSDGFNLDPGLVYSLKNTTRNLALHLKLVRLSPSIQNPLALNLSAVNASSSTQLLSTSPSSAGASGEGAALPLASYQGFFDTVPEQGMSGGAVVDSQCSLLGVTESRSIYGEGGTFVRLSPSVAQRVMAAVDQL